jgi:hypothetical protein
VQGVNSVKHQQPKPEIESESDRSRNRSRRRSSSTFQKEKTTSKVINLHKEEKQMHQATERDLQCTYFCALEEEKE